MASIGKAHVDLVMSTRWDALDPIIAVVFWAAMTGLGSLVGMCFGIAVR